MILIPQSPSSVFDRLGGLQITQKTVSPTKNETSAAARIVAKTAAAAAAQTVIKKTLSSMSSSPAITGELLRVFICFPYLKKHFHSYQNENGYGK